MSREKGCKFCIRHGLPLLPIRPGIMASDDIYPVLPAGLSTPLPAQGELAWTGRLLREGFLYIWAESAKRWINYFVTAEGYYYPLPEDGVVPSDIASGCVKPCISNPAELASASLITLPVKPLGMKNGLFWFCWSEVAWTMQVRRQHEEEACRSEVMQAFDMDAWLAGGKTTQAVSVDGLERTVAEFAPDASSGGIPLWSALSRKARGPDETEEEEEEEAKKLPWKKVKPGEGMYLRQAAEGLLAGKGAILLLQDPPAILQELSVIIEYELQNKVYGNPEYQRELALAGAIGSLEKGIRKQCEHAFIEQVEKQKANGGSYVFRTQAELLLKNPSSMNDAIKKISDKKWAEYEKYYDPQKVIDFHEKFDGLLKQYNEQIVVPRTDMYLKWMKSAHLLSYFKHHFDQDDLVSCLSYTSTVIYSIWGMQDKLELSRFFTEQLSGSPADRHNFLLRAFSFNHRQLSEKLQKGATSSPDWLALPWSWLADTFELHLSGQVENAQRLMTLLTVQCAGPLMRLMTKAATDNEVYASLVAIGAISDKAMVRIERHTLFKHFLKEVVDELAKKAGIKPSGPMYDSLYTHVRREMLRLWANDLPMNLRVEKSFMVMIDTHDIDEVKPLKGQSLVKAVSKLLRSGPEGEAIQFSRWQGKVNKWERRQMAKQRLSRMQQATQNNIAIEVSARSVHLGVVSSLLQGAALLITADIDKKTLTADQKEAHNRFYGGVMAFGSTVVATIETAIKYHQFSTRLIPLKWIGIRILWAGRGVGVIGGYLYAAEDYKNGMNEIDKRRTGLGIAYFVSGVTGFALSLIAAKVIPVSGAVAIVLAIIFLTANAIIMEFTPDAIQKWLRQCLWRRIPVNDSDTAEEQQLSLQKEMADLPIWPTMEMEIQQLNLALGNGG